jgi:hypothetical protein
MSQLITTLLWSSTGDDGKPLDSCDHQVSDELRNKLEAEYQEFIDSLPEHFDAEDYYIGIATSSADQQLAHDYILTRNRHGAGFWDGDWGKEMGELLTDLAQRKPEIECYIGDDGLVYA